MSGLAALFQRDGRPVQPEALRAMLAAIPYRGPDGQHQRCQGAVALGQARMVMTPEERDEHQPLVSPRTGCWLIADARLDNRADLLARLPDAVAPTASDGDLILRAYETWGEAAPTRLLGDFAFVIWDPGRRQLFGARDGGGQRVLFYRYDRQTVAIASEIHQLFQDPAVPIAPNDDRVRDYLTPLNVFRNERDQAATFYAGIACLPAGHALAIDAENAHLWRYADLEPPAELRHRRDEDYAEHFRALFFEAVRARLRAAGPVGVSLSGGLDSSAIVCAAQELGRAGQADLTGFATFSFVFDGLECDERDLIGDIQATYDFPAHFITGGALAGRLQLEPRGFRESPNMGLEETRDAMFQRVSQAGVRAFLTGEVADSFIGGSPLVFDSLLRQGRLADLGRYLRAYRAASDESLKRIVGLYMLAPLLPLGPQRRLLSGVTARAIRAYGRNLVPAWLPEPVQDDLVARHLRLCLAAEAGRRFANPTREAAYRLLAPPELARHPVPWSVQFWRPFADRRLHEFMLAIPPEQQYQPLAEAEPYAGSKWLMRRALRGILPERIRTRASKTIFGAIHRSEIAQHWPLYQAAFGPTARPAVAERGYVDQGRFFARLQELAAGQPGPDLSYVMKIVELETWFRAFQLARPALVTVPPARVAPTTTGPAIPPTGPAPVPSPFELERAAVAPRTTVVAASG